VGVAENRRERLRAAAMVEIKDAARAQMAEAGPASISLRAVARRVGMNASNLYRYFATLDDLITALVADGYWSFAAGLREARDSLPAADVAGRLLAVGHAYRRWALDHPSEFGLIFGDPIPGYKAPADGPTAQAAAEASGVVLAVYVDAWRAGTLVPPDADRLPDRLRERLRVVAGAWDPEAPPGLVLLFLRDMLHIHGMVSFEVFGHTQVTIGEPELLYRVELLAMLERSGLTPPG
jgi:AcrR family transcriptional regulator